MTIHQTLFATYDNPLVLCDSADFDGTNDYMLRGGGLTGAADSKTGIFSCWYRIDGGDGNLRYLMQGVVSGITSRFRVWQAQTTNLIEVTGMNAAGGTILNLQSSAYTAGATWLHILASWNLATPISSLYINDVDDNTPTLTDDTIDYTLADWAIATRTDAAGKLDGCLAEFYFAPGQYLDFSNVYNRRKFISATGKPVSLGATGSLPTGTAPVVYQRGADAAAVATFATNLGTGGDFTITGTLTTGSTSPSD